ncbi:uncharacterized protein CTRU02_213657 [Colletotrichum truncatum]|uniref:Uncharacterized protein n=1 Tax=Colletotrichum truncatum TaxID=5467 RepID=A0ACC3YGC9_COLTU
MKTTITFQRDKRALAMASDTAEAYRRRPQRRLQGYGSEMPTLYHGRLLILAVSWSIPTQNHTRRVSMAARAYVVRALQGRELDAVPPVPAPQDHANGNIIAITVIVDPGLAIWFLIRQKNQSRSHGAQGPRPPPQNQSQKAQPYVVAPPPNQQQYNQQYNQPYQQPQQYQQYQKQEVQHEHYDYVGKNNYQQQPTPTSPVPEYQQTVPFQGSGGQDHQVHEVPATNTRGTGNNAAELG